jgi:hypothetical protein
VLGLTRGKIVWHDELAFRKHRWIAWLAP